MLSELRVRNFAIIEDLSMRLEPGLNVLTGETGAGKSILVGALGIALGERAFSEQIKTGAKEAVVEASFGVGGLSLLTELGIDSSDGITVRRNVSASGKGKAYINDTTVSVQTLADVGNLLVDMHGQHEHQSLLSGERQLDVVDSYGKLADDREKLVGLYREAGALRAELEDLLKNRRDRAERTDFLKFQINEIAAASLNPGEDEELEKERNLLMNAARLRELAESAYAALYESEGSGIEKLQSALNALAEMASIDESAGEPLGMLKSALPLAKEAASGLRAVKEAYDLDPKRLDSLEERLHLINTLKKKYGGAIEAALQFMQKAEAELGGVENADERAAGIEGLLKEKEAGLAKAAKSLSEKRKKAAVQIEKEIKSLLKDLALEKAAFGIEFTETRISPSGADSVEFMFSANPGEDAKPLRKVASGGELSRIMLAVKTALRGADSVPVLIFDEVDAGIGGATAKSVGRKLKELSKARQVICITHLPQIASMADNHILIEKRGEKGGVRVTINRIEGEERLREIARMLSGDVTAKSLVHAKELLEGAR